MTQLYAHMSPGATLAQVGGHGLVMNDHGISAAQTDQIAQYLEGVDIAAPGQVLPFAWAPAAGTTQAEVIAATLTLSPAMAEEVHSAAGFAADGAGWAVTIPPHRRARAFGLIGFKTAGGDALDNLGQRRLTIAFPRPGGGWEAPRFAYPAVGRQGAIPRSLTGADWANGTLTINPSVKAAKARIALVEGATPAEFADQATRLSQVRLVTHTAARDLRVLGPDGALLWASPEFDPDGPAAQVDLTLPLGTALTAALAAGQPPAAAVTVVAAAPARAILHVTAARGRLVRTVPGTLSVELAGLPAALPLPPPFAAEQPSHARADLRIRYHGVRLHPDLTDLAPAAGPPAGTIVGAGGTVRVLPPQALRGVPVARIGLRGRVPEDAEIAVDVVDAGSGAALGPPAVTRLSPGPIAPLWLALPAPLAPQVAAAVRVRANSGRFFWANDARGLPALGVAVSDPDPGDRPIRLGPADLVRLHDSRHEAAGAALPAAGFAGGAPLLSSDLFATIELVDLRLEYAR